MLHRIAHDNGVVTYRSPVLGALGVPHGFTTRIGGVSPAPFDTLDLGVGGSPEHRAENLRRLQHALGLPHATAIPVSQVHGCGVALVDSPAAPPPPTTQADALVTDRPAALLVIRTADCVPILLAGPGGKVVAAVHAGWRGVIADVLGQTLRTFHHRYGIEPRDLAAAVGPCISAAHFEVGEEVAAAFAAADLHDAIDRTRGEKPHIDLPAAVLTQLICRGVARDRIDTTDRCTYRDAQEFFSYRRDAGRTGRMAAVISPAA